MTWEQQHLALSYYVLRDCPEFLTDSMVRVLVKHGYRTELPDTVAARFAHVLKEILNKGISSAPVEGLRRAGCNRVAWVGAIDVVSEKISSAPAEVSKQPSGAGASDSDEKGSEPWPQHACKRQASTRESAPALPTQQPGIFAAGQRRSSTRNAAGWSAASTLHSRHTK